MFIKELVFKNFRNLNLKLELAPKVNLVIDNNGAGKSNLIDGIYYLANARSFRKFIEGGNITWESKLGFARISALIKNEEEFELAIAFSLLSEGKSSKRLEVNKLPKSRRAFTGMLTCVLFAPHDLDIINGSPDIRRSELDTFLSAVDEYYEEVATQFKQVLRNRNRVLLGIAEGNASRRELSFWNEKLVEMGAVLLYNRINLIRDFNPVLTEKANALFNSELKSLEIAYVSKFAEARNISEAKDMLQLSLQENQHKELAARKSLYGPHRDDFEMMFNLRPVKVYGSRGQQRLAALILKLAMWQFLKNEHGSAPLLLFDDVMSELDRSHRQNLEKVITETDAQVVMTATDESDFTKRFLENACRLELN